MNPSHVNPLGQLVIVGVRDYRWMSRLERALVRLQPSGVLLYPGSLRSPGQTVELLHKIACTLRDPPFLAIAEEGGTVDPLRAFLPPLPAPRVLARRGPTAVKRLGELIGAAMQLLGFNLNLAPRLDLSNPDVKPALDTQTFGADPRQVAQCGRAFIEGLGKHQILACGKHFPGRGVPGYGEYGLPVVAKTMVELWREDLLPFRELLAHLPFIKLSNVSYKAYDFDAPQPAAMSSNIVSGLLHTKLGFRRLAVGDPLELLEEASCHAGPDEVAFMRRETFVHSVNAGCDLQVVTWGEKTADRVLSEMRRAVETGLLTKERVAQALQRIRAVKEGLKRPTGKLSARSLDRLAREFEEFSQLVALLTSLLRPRRI